MSFIRLDSSHERRPPTYKELVTINWKLRSELHYWKKKLWNLQRRVHYYSMKAAELENQIGNSD